MGKPAHTHTQSHTHAHVMNFCQINKTIKKLFDDVELSTHTVATIEDFIGCLSAKRLSKIFSFVFLFCAMRTFICAPGWHMPHSVVQVETLFRIVLLYL